MKGGQSPASHQPKCIKKAGGAIASEAIELCCLARVESVCLDAPLAVILNEIPGVTLQLLHSCVSVYVNE